MKLARPKQSVMGHKRNRGAFKKGGGGGNKDGGQDVGPSGGGGGGGGDYEQERQAAAPLLALHPSGAVVATAFGSNIRVYDRK